MRIKRREFVKTVGALSVGSSIAAVPASADPLVSTTDDLNARPEPSSVMVAHCKKILEQNQLRAGETLVVATSMVFDHNYFLAMLVAAGEIGATGAHIVVFPKIRGSSYESGLMAWHWDIYASADLLITSSIGRSPGIPGPSTAYNSKVGNHSYRTDHEYINRPGAKTRWLSLGGDLARQRRYFPTEERKQRTLRAARLLDETRGELRVESDAGSNWRCSNEGRPGHAQYGIADTAGRWDNFGYGCVAVGPQEDSAEGELVLQAGDIVTSMYPRVLDDSIKLTFEAGYVTKVEGGKRARQFEELLASYNNAESYGIGHFGWGVHESTRLTGDADIGHYHHNTAGSLLYALGMNFGHGVGGRGAGYSGLGMTTRVAPNHTHFAMFNCDVYVGGQKVVDRGIVSRQAGGV